MLDDQIDTVLAEQVAAGETVHRPANQAEVESVRQQAQILFGASLPPEYQAFLSRTNGLDFDGVVIYGASQSTELPDPAGFWQGLADANRLWRESGDHQSYLILGETDMDLMTVNLDGQNATTRDKVSGDETGHFRDVAAMFSAVLGQHLN